MMLSSKTRLLHAVRTRHTHLRQPLACWASTSATTSTNAAEATTSATNSSKASSSSKLLSGKNVALFTAGIAVGSFVTAQLSAAEDDSNKIQYPSGLPRACSCEEHPDATKHVSLQNLSDDQKALAGKLEKIVGAENVLNGAKETTQTTPFLKGMRLGHGQALCIVTPRRLKHVYEMVPLILQAGCTVLPQGQNTGLTGGSTPRQESTDARPVVVLSMKHLDTIVPVDDDGQRVLCLAGVGLAQLDRYLNETFPTRESHANLGSTFLNPTTAAGVAFGSGGTQCMRKGPAYTDRALYLKVNQDKWGQPQVEVVNTLGISKLTDSKAIVGQDTKFKNAIYKLDALAEGIKGGYDVHTKIETDKGIKTKAHNEDYRKTICKQDKSLSRFNADTRGADCNRSEGKVMILATVHDTFPKAKSAKTFWIGFESIDLALEFRRNVVLANPEDLPLSCEYMDRDAFDVIDGAGRVMATVISWFGTTSATLRNFWQAKSYIEALPFASASTIVDKLLYNMNYLFPSVLPKDVKKTGEKLDHHVAMTVGDFGDGGMERLLERMDAFVAKHGKDKVMVHDCTKDVGKLSAFRFVAAPCFRTYCVGNKIQGVSVDYVLPKNGGAVPALTSGKDDSSDGAVPVKRMRYSHFGCNVVHEDLAYAPNVDLHKAKYGLKNTVEKKCGGKLPAEHGHGTEYHAPPDAQKRWMKMDPMNVLNPGVGGLSTQPGYK